MEPLLIRVGIMFEEIINCLKYNPESGVLTWAKARGCRKAGSVAGCLDSNGYKDTGKFQVRIRGKSFGCYPTLQEAKLIVEIELRRALDEAMDVKRDGY